MHSPASITIRLATLEDIPKLEALIAESVRTLQAPDYSEEQREGALGTVFGVDRQLIRDGTYFAAEAGPDIVACGGWSKRKTLFGSDHVSGKNDDCLDPQIDAAKIRAFFVHPSWARRGLGSRIMTMSEEAARASGFSRLELGATLTGVPLYERHGFHLIERLDVALSNGASLPIVRMAKQMGSAC